MADIAYDIEAHDSLGVPTGVLVPNLTPTFTYFKALATGVDVTPQPDIDEISGMPGVYRFLWDVVADGEIMWQVDLGVSLQSDFDRYLSNRITIAGSVPAVALAATALPTPETVVANSMGEALLGLWGANFGSQDKDFQNRKWTMKAPDGTTTIVEHTFDNIVHPATRRRTG